MWILNVTHQVTMSVKTSVCFLTLVCINGYYGGSCENNCGYCLDGEQCDKQNGICIRGCQPHFLHPLCKGNLIYM